ncbi:thiamine biosynthesis protein ThiS [Wolinella succinogenes]|nr:thiamine biosynthesis protein ThiS [Wolinella succinogenes]
MCDGVNGMKKVWINGEEREFLDALTLLEMIESLGIMEKVMAAAVNTQIIKQAEWGAFIPKAGDRIELLQFVGGGER